MKSSVYYAKDREELARLTSHMQQTGFDYYNTAWPRKPWKTVDVDLKKAQNDALALRKRLYRLENKDGAERASLTKAMEETERKYLAARVNPANQDEEARRHYASTLEGSAEWRDQSMLKPDDGPSTSMSATVPSALVLDQATNTHASSSESADHLNPSFYTSYTSPGSPGSPTIAAHLLDPSDVDLTW